MAGGLDLPEPIAPLGQRCVRANIPVAYRHARDDSPHRIALPDLYPNSARHRRTLLPPPGDSAGERASGDPGRGSVTELSRIERTSTDRDRGSTQALWEQLERALAEPGPAVGRGWISWNLPSLPVLDTARNGLLIVAGMDTLTAACADRDRGQPVQDMLGLRERMEENGSAPGTGEAKRSAAAPADPEVVDRPLRRRFSPSYKLRIVEEADRCTEPGEVGQVLRREGLYSSHLTTWRKAAHSGSLKALSKKRGRKPERNPLDEKVRKLERRNARLENELRKAHLIIDVQGKVAGLLGISLDDGTNS